MIFKLKEIDNSVAQFMKKWGVSALRISFAIIFFWFGILKPFGLSAAIPLVKATVVWLPFIEPDVWVHVIGWWEVVICI